MRISQIIKRLDELHDQVKYHSASIPNVPEFLEGLSDELRDINADELMEARTNGAEHGFNHARKLIINRILKNAKLKTRGDMITAAELLDGTEETVLPKETEETKTEDRSVHAN